MTLDWRKYWWQPGFALAFFAVGIPYWLIPYNKLNLPGAVLGVELVVVVAVAALARLYSGKSFMRVVTVMGGVLPAVVMARVVVDGLFDYSAHNLWPFELIIAILVGGAAALAGALIGSVVLWLSRRGQDDERAGRE
jgi:hypothetical protein